MDQHRNDDDHTTPASVLDRLAAAGDLPTVAHVALSEAAGLTNADGGIVIRTTPDGLDPVGCEPPTLFDYEHISKGCLPRLAETGQPFAAITHDEPSLVDLPVAIGAAPIIVDGTITGAIVMVRRSAVSFSTGDLEALEELAPHVGAALQSVETALAADNTFDVEPLTGLQNRRRLDLDLASISTDDEVAYVMVDIDHFRIFNDANGHVAGDEALRQISALLQAAVRPNDLVYRYGGEEFCVLLPATTAEEALVVAERARAAVETADIPGMENQPTGVVTISIGVSDSAFGMPIDLIERADAALCASKRNGRNRVTLSSDESR